MPTAFQVFAVDRFPPEEAFETEEQLTLLGDIENNMEITSTKVAKVPPHPPGLTQFLAQHDFLFQLTFPGRARGTEFREFVTLYKFPIFLGSDNDACGFRPLLVKTKKKVAADFTKRLNTKIDAFVVRPTSLDFDCLRPRLELIRGAWFGNIRQPHLASAGVFGQHVDLSDEFKHAEEVGELKNLLIELQAGESTHTVMVTGGGGIVLYYSYQTVEDEVHVAVSALNGILAGCLQPT